MTEIKQLDQPCTRPVLRWHGGKWRIARWIIAHFPAHVTYVEPYGGAASVLLQKKPAGAEVWNDLDQTLVGLFRVLRDPVAAAELVRQLRLTPSARDEFYQAYELSDDPIERARRTIVRSFQGFGSDGTNGVYRTGFRANVSSTLKLPAKEWASFPEGLELIINRMREVVIENIDAIALMKRVDASGTLHYVDPPYLPQTRSAGSRRRGAGYHVYVHDMETEDHDVLLAALQQLRGMVVLSGYPSEIYDDTLAGWKRFNRNAWADGARPRTECIWLNPAALAAMPTPRML